MKTTYKLKQPLLGWAKGEHFIYDDEWNEWTRQKTGETFSYRTSVSSGEIVILFNLIAYSKLDTILMPVQKPEPQPHCIIPSDIAKQVGKKS